MSKYISPEHIIFATFCILLTLVILTWIIIICKTWQLKKNAVNNQNFDQFFLSSSNLSDMKILSDNIFKCTHANIAHEGLAWINEYLHLQNEHFAFQGDAFDLLQHRLEKQLQYECYMLESGLTMLASIGSTAPFIGLFGTVLGIMNAMHNITMSGSTNLNVVAGPIGDALVATAIGIAVAVPAVLAYNFFLQDVKHQRQKLKQFTTHFLFLIESYSLSF